MMKRALLLASVVLPVFGAIPHTPPASRLPPHGGWKDPLAFPAPASSTQRKAILDRAHKAAASVPQDIRNSIKASKAKIDKQVLNERTEALGQLGIDRRSVGYLTILVSSSMPQVMLNGYAQSAVWAGGVLSFRGVDPGHSIAWFITHVMHSMVRKGSSPSITLDPRVFSAYGVTSVPVIVYSTARPDTLCAKQVVKTLKRPKKKPLHYHDCAPADPATYWKMTGAVSVAYALRQFAAAGAPGAKLLLRAIQADPLSGMGRQPLMLDRAAYSKAQGPGSLADVLHLMNAPVPQLLGSPAEAGTTTGGETP